MTFISRMCANLDLDPATAQFGWKTLDDAQSTPARQLVTEDDLKNAFRDVLRLKNGPGRKEAVMLIVHLVRLLSYFEQ